MLSHSVWLITPAKDEECNFHRPTNFFFTELSSCMLEYLIYREIIDGSVRLKFSAFSRHLVFYVLYCLMDFDYYRIGKKKVKNYVSAIYLFVYLAFKFTCSWAVLSQPFKGYYLSGYNAMFPVMVIC